MTNWVKYAMNVLLVSFHSTLQINVDNAVMNSDSKNALEELKLLLEMGIGDIPILVKKFINVIVKTVFLRKKNTNCIVATIFVQKDILELLVIVATMMECSGVTIISRRVPVFVVDAMICCILS